MSGHAVAESMDSTLRGLSSFTSKLSNDNRSQRSRSREQSGSWAADSLLIGGDMAVTDPEMLADKEGRTKDDDDNQTTNQPTT